MAITEGRIDAGELTFGYLDTGGDGPLALCLHGFPDSPWGWKHLLPALADAGYRAVAPWLRGYAPTSVPADGCYQSGAIANDANSLHEALGGDGDAVIIGHDWGALATYGAVGSAPERWRRVVAAAVPPPATLMRAMLSVDQLQRSWYMFFFLSPLSGLVAPADDLALIDRLWSEWSPGLSAEDRAEAVAAVKDALRDPANLEAALGYYRATVGTGPRSPEFDAVEAAGFAPMPKPTLYLHGVDDGCMLSSFVDDETAAALPVEGSRVELVPDAGHFLQLEQPEVVNRLILDFLAG
jgi:pimeloyl-ACP methyl ester carboxylesterase